jgi:hypothetical protein
MRLRSYKMFPGFVVTGSNGSRSSFRKWRSEVRTPEHQSRGCALPKVITGPEWRRRRSRKKKLKRVAKACLPGTRRHGLLESVGLVCQSDAIRLASQDGGIKEAVVRAGAALTSHLLSVMSPFANARLAECGRRGLVGFASGKIRSVGPVHIQAASRSVPSNGIPPIAKKAGS